MLKKMSTVNKELLLVCGTIVFISGLLFVSIFVAGIDRFQGHREERVLQLRDLLAFYNSLEEGDLKEEGVFLEMARKGGILREHPLAIDKLEECYRVRKVKAAGFPVIIENSNVGSAIKYAAYIDGRIDVFEEP